MKHSLIAILFLFISTTSCTEKRSNNGENLVVREGFNNGSCFDVKQLELMFRGPLAKYYTQVTTTDFEVVRSESAHTDALMAYKHFGVRKTTGAGSGIVSNVIAQSGCDTVDFRTTGGPPLRFKITKKAIDHVALSIEKDTSDTLPEVRRDAIYLTPQPIAYDFTLLEGNRLQIKTTYKTVSPVCNSDDTFTYRVTKIVEWQNTPERLSGTVAIDKSYLSRYLSTLQTAPSVRTEGPLPVAQIQSLAVSPARAQFLYCL